ncbi:MAG: glycosidase, partial [Lachnospiraceae bacterium]|nr:glycosidase [Lachnospiraceae bacterium]
MLNAYPDSMGGTLKDIAGFLSSEDLKGTFSSFYILPSLYHTDLDRGFSVIDYSLEESLAKKEDLDALQDMGIDLKLDFILNHASVQSPQFRDLVKNGEASPYKDFFINWNEFWKGLGEMTPEGYIKPDDKYIKDMFFRKPGLPILMVKMPDGKKVPYWNTFYQEVKETPEGEKYLGQMDLNIKSPLVWDFYDDTLKKISEYGASIVRLDAFAYAPKEPGLKNFLNEPGTWDLLSKVRALADKYGLTLLPEIHASYSEKIYETIADKGYMTYDF